MAQTANPRPKWDVHNPHSHLGQGFVTTMRKIYHPVGFHKGYNFLLFIIGVGGLFGFVLSRLFYFDINGVFAQKAIPGEFYYYQKGASRIGIILHLTGVLPGGFLACLQFVPIIRYKALIFHRINGYIAILLLLLGNSGAFMIINHAVGGSPVMQAWVGLLGAMTTIGLLLAYINIKRLQIDQHRAWMLRVWTWAASIVTLRLILLAAQHVSKVYGYVFHTSIRCAEIWFMYNHVGVPPAHNPTRLLYPTCEYATDARTGQLLRGSTVNPMDNVSTFVSVSSFGTGPENTAAELRTTFVMAAWLATIIHAIVIEIYLWLTPAESYRLRNVSYQRQVEAGLRPKGRFRDAGLTASAIGDAPKWWSIPADEYEEMRLKGKIEPLAKAPTGGEIHRHKIGSGEDSAGDTP